MPLEIIDVSDLFECSNHVEFLERCYQTLLSRAISISGLSDSLALLKRGMPREALVYCISKSPEFHERFQILHIKTYQYQYYFYKIKRILCKPFSRPPKIYTASNCDASAFISDFKVLSEYDFDFDTEYDALALCQISQIETCLSALKSGSWVAVGDLASEILAPVTSTVSHRNAFEFHEKTADLYLKSSSLDDAYFITSPKIVYDLLTKTYLSSFSRRIRDYFVFTMPVLPIPCHAVSVIWGEHFSGVDVQSDGSQLRWLCGEHNQGTLVLYNNSNNYKKVTLRFTLISAEPGAELIWSFGSVNMRHSFCDIHATIEQDIYLNPHSNHLHFTYIGKGTTITSDHSRLYKFAIRDLSITECSSGSSIRYDRDQIYRLDCDTYGKNYYSYMLSDSYIRSRLHENGFFEVSAYHLSKSYDIAALDTTRYNEERALQHQFCSYTFKHGDEFDCSSHSGVMVYIASRKGVVSIEEFDFSL